MSIQNDLELTMVRMGFDFETHGGKDVVYKGGGHLPEAWLPVGTKGEILYTVPGSHAEVQVRWSNRECFAHRWEELE